MHFLQIQMMLELLQLELRDLIELPRRRNYCFTTHSRRAGTFASRLPAYRQLERDSKCGIPTAPAC
jgi:hypothetical protein